MGFSEVIVINPTMSTFEYNVTIKADNEFETPEVFQAIIDQPNAPILIANNANLATITIEEGIGKGITCLYIILITLSRAMAEYSKNNVHVCTN